MSNGLNPRGRGSFSWGLHVRHRSRCFAAVHAGYYLLTELYLSFALASFRPFPLQDLLFLRYRLPRCSCIDTIVSFLCACYLCGLLYELDRCVQYTYVGQNSSWYRRRREIRSANVRRSFSCSRCPPRWVSGSFGTMMGGRTGFGDVGQAVGE